MDKKTYTGGLMAKGEETESFIKNWLLTIEEVSKVIDVRGNGQARKDDVDYIVVLKKNREIKVEVKSDKWISEDRNMFFEICRLNHTSKFETFYEGWGYRSKADSLIIRNPDREEVFTFLLKPLREKINKYISEAGNNLNIKSIKTDRETTTLGLLIPMTALKGFYRKYMFNNIVNFERKAVA